MNGFMLLLLIFLQQISRALKMKDSSLKEGRKAPEILANDN